MANRAGEDAGTTAAVRVAPTWDGAPARPDEVVTLRLSRLADLVVVEVDAPFHGDPLPPGRPGRCDGLWDHEVVEVFFLGAGERYLEVELGPHGHFLALQLEGVRAVRDDRLDLVYEARVEGDRWFGRAEVPAAWLPTGLARFNAYAIHGAAPRRFLALHPVPGPAPDFHRLDRFGPLPDSLR